jgi:hypothetical protein
VGLLGTIEPRADAVSGKSDWIRLIGTHPELSPMQAREGINPFSRRPMLFKASPDAARVLLEQDPIGSIYWAMDDSRRLVVSAEAGFEARVLKVAHDVASRLGWSFVAHEGV